MSKCQGSHGIINNISLKYYHFVTFHVSIICFTALKVRLFCPNWALTFFSPFITTQKNMFTNEQM